MKRMALACAAFLAAWSIQGWRERRIKTEKELRERERYLRFIGRAVQTGEGMVERFRQAG